MLSKLLAGASARPILLSVLAEGESYGYEIIQRIQDLSGGTLVWNDGTLYPVLHRLEDEGLVTAAWRLSDEGRRRKYYRLAEAGHAALAEEKRQWLRVDHILAKLWGLQPHLLPS
jgi:PadR family transcriptional regulator PadR